jgi:hypothetical protein
MISKLIIVTIALAVFSSSCLANPTANQLINALTKAHKRREVIVDDNGFYLGGGSNNNLREASQLYDLGGPIVNPWINAFTQPIERVGVAQRLGANGLGGFAAAGLGGLGAGLGGVGLGGVGLGGVGLGGVGLGGIGGIATNGIAAGGVMPSTATAGGLGFSGLSSATTTSNSNIDLNSLAQLVLQLAQQQQTQTQQASQMSQLQQMPMQQTVSHTASFDATAGQQTKQLQPFTAIFMNNGQAPLFKVGLPADYPNGYTTV